MPLTFLPKPLVAEVLSYFVPTTQLHMGLEPYRSLDTYLKFPGDHSKEIALSTRVCRSMRDFVNGLKDRMNREYNGPRSQLANRIEAVCITQEFAPLAIKDLKQLKAVSLRKSDVATLAPLLKMAPSIHTIELTDLDSEGSVAALNEITTLRHFVLGEPHSPSSGEKLPKLFHELTLPFETMNLIQSYSPTHWAAAIAPKTTLKELRMIVGESIPDITNTLPSLSKLENLERLFCFCCGDTLLFDDMTLIHTLLAAFPKLQKMTFLLNCSASRYWTIVPTLPSRVSLEIGDGTIDISDPTQIRSYLEKCREVTIAMPPYPETIALLQNLPNLTKITLSLVGHNPSQEPIAFTRSDARQFKTAFPDKMIFFNDQEITSQMLLEPLKPEDMLPPPQQETLCVIL